MPYLARAIKNKTELENIPGIVLKREDKTLYINEPAWIEDFNDYPLPDMDLVNKKFYRRKNRGCTITVTARGCPMKCSYCSVGASSSCAKFRARSDKWTG